MDKSTSETDSDSEKKGRFKALKFQRLGKYFLLVLVLGVQAFIAYTIVEKNYESVYNYANSFFPEERGQYELEQIIVNPADTNGHRYLLVELSLELRDKEDEQLIESNLSKIRNSLIEYLSSLPVTDLQGRDRKENLRLELVKIINSTIDQRSVRNLYYSKYVMQ
ncbi:flagellar FliL protein [Fodinibius roseus]|uniref:Flagellar protein FliL n=1 Tax=Fodinibius roseus TaxID=1194090 RepID=A0A1M5HF94_9BACT|nr:flagellar basal body-associated FliL family protein [Fodinibius roseus]SHG14620.1 flagellar FliL protein [Fodinibius roseus]